MTPSESLPQRPVIMVVDDANTMLRAAMQFLTPTYDVLPVADGFAALAAIQESRPDLVLLDVSMPRLDGYQTCLAIKDNPDFRKLPVVLMTSKDSPFDRARGKLVGCDAYITKPFKQDDLLTTVERCLRSA